MKNREKLLKESCWYYKKPGKWKASTERKQSQQEHKKKSKLQIFVDMKG